MLFSTTHLVWLSLSLGGFCTPVSSESRKLVHVTRQMMPYSNATITFSGTCKKDMPGLKIEVIGSSIISRPAERAVMSINVRSEGPDQAKVALDVTNTSNDIQALLKPLLVKDASGQAVQNSSVTQWSMTSLSTSSYQPYEDGKRTLARIYTASTTLSVEFADFAKLGQISTQLASKPYVNVNSISWQLTKETRKAFATEGRKMAVDDAFTKAKDYAEAAGKSNLVYCEMKDSSSDGGNSGPYPVPMYAMARSGAADSAPQLSFEPEKLDIRSTVSVSYVAE